ncbi:MAG TPA: rhodanese-like domain-containing protein [Stellaceae bacterium]|nr:rhodanese-like domain-containing protein [Stellaceae bacterium]
MTQTYAGDVSVTATWKALEEDPRAVLVDVRTQAEWNYVGLPDLSSLGKPVVRVQWQTWPEGAVNPSFAEEVAAAGVEPDQHVYLICRSGARSRSAAQLLTQKGWRNAYNVADGFEGPHDGARHRGTVAGWKHDGLPWAQG